MTDTATEVEELFHLVISKDELMVILLGMLGVDGLVHNEMDEAILAMVVEYVKVRLTTPAKVHEGLHRLEEKLQKLADHLEVRRKECKE
jgi:hypothetical protein